MPELAEVKIMSEYINYVNKKETFISVEKSKENKNPKIEVSYKRFKVSAMSRGKELMLIISDTLFQGELTRINDDDVSHFSKRNVKNSVCVTPSYHFLTLRI